MKINVKKVYGETPKNAFEASDLAIKAQNDLVSALHIMISIIQYPNDMDIHRHRIELFLNDFCDETDAK